MNHNTHTFVSAHTRLLGSSRGEVWLITTISLCVGLLWPHAVAACSVSPCKRFVPEDGATVPRNTPAFAWMDLNGSEEDWGAVKLTRIDGVEPQEVAVSVERQDRWIRWLRPSELVAGARYRLEQRDPDEFTGKCSFAAEVTVAEEAPLPTSLGRAVATARQLDSGGFPCSTVVPFVAAHSPVYLSLDEQAGSSS